MSTETQTADSDVTPKPTPDLVYAVDLRTIAGIIRKIRDDEPELEVTHAQRVEMFAEEGFEDAHPDIPSFVLFADIIDNKPSVGFAPFMTPEAGHEDILGYIAPCPYTGVMGYSTTERAVEYGHGMATLDPEHLEEAADTIERLDAAVDAGATLILGTVLPIHLVGESIGVGWLIAAPEHGVDGYGFRHGDSITDPTNNGTTAS